MGVQGNDFRYFLTLDNERTEIVFAPDGWDKNTEVSNIRNMAYFGMTRTMALPLQFVYDGADILRKAYYKYSFEAEVRIEVEKIDKSFSAAGVWGYQQIFRGDIDFSQFKDLKDHVSVTLMESGATRNIKAFESVKYEYPLVGDDVVNIILPGVEYSEVGKFTVFPSIEQNFSSMPAVQYILGLNSGVLTGQSVEERNGIDVNQANGYWFVRINKLQELTFNGRIKGTAYTKIVQGPATFHVEIRNQINEVVEHIGQVTSPPTLGNTPFDFNISFTRTFSEETYLFLTVRGTGDDDNYCMIEEGDIEISFSSTSPQSTCKGISALNLYRRIIRKISPGTEAISYLLANNWKNLIFTSGDGIREIEDAKIKITFQEFYDTINAIEDAGFGIEGNTAVLELAPYFARNVQIMDLGEVKDCVIDPARELACNSLKIGYDDGNTDEPDGREEYNSGQEWALPITRFQKPKSWVSPTRADQYGIEKIRVDYNIKKLKGTNDTSSDNDTFMVHCYIDGPNYRPILGSSYDSVSGFKDPDNGLTSYNLQLTPKQNLLRHSGYLRSILDKMDGRYISFGSGTKNTEVTTVINGFRVKESEDIGVSSLNGKYFLPNIATITVDLPRNAMAMFDLMPFGYVSFTWRNTSLKGYLLDVTIDIAKNKEQELRLLLTNDNNLENLN